MLAQGTNSTFANIIIANQASPACLPLCAILGPLLHRVQISIHLEDRIVAETLSTALQFIGINRTFDKPKSLE